MFSRLPIIMGRIAYSAHRFSAHLISETMGSANRRVNLIQPSIATPVVMQVRGFKDKEVLKIRCKDCYFKKVDDRWWVLCKTHPRHKQREKVYDIRSKWIVTHITRTGYPFRKHFQYPNHDL